MNSERYMQTSHGFNIEFEEFGQTRRGIKSFSYMRRPDCTPSALKAGIRNNWVISSSSFTLEFRFSTFLGPLKHALRGQRLEYDELKQRVWTDRKLQKILCGGIGKNYQTHKRDIVYPHNTLFLNVRAVSVAGRVLTLCPSCVTLTPLCSSHLHSQLLCQCLYVEVLGLSVFWLSRWFSQWRP
jgi:hypothetical protein